MAVYFIVSGDHVKIGVSKHPESRLSEMQTGSPLRLELALVIPGDRETEKSLHRQFEHHHTHGEWFRFDQQIKEFIAEHRDDAKTPIEDQKKKAYLEGAYEAIAHVVGQYWKYHIGIKHPDMYSAIRGYVETFTVMRYFWAIDKIEKIPDDPDYSSDRLAQMQDAFNTELAWYFDRDNRAPFESYEIETDCQDDYAVAMEDAL